MHSVHCTVGTQQHTGLESTDSMRQGRDLGHRGLVGNLDSMEVLLSTHAHACLARWPEPSPHAARNE